MNGVRALISAGLTPNRIARIIAKASLGGVGLMPRLKATALAGTYTRAIIEGVAEQYSATELRKALVYFYCLRNDWEIIKDSAGLTPHQNQAVSAWLEEAIKKYEELHRTKTAPSLL